MKIKIISVPLRAQMARSLGMRIEAFQYTINIVEAIFSRVHASLYLAPLVGRSVGLSVCWSVASRFGSKAFSRLAEEYGWRRRRTRLTEKQKAPQNQSLRKVEQEG